MFLAEPFEMRKCVLTLSLAKLRWDEKAGLEYNEVLFMLIHLVKMVTCHPRFLNCSFYKFFVLYQVIFIAQDL
jgi:hypothetical protein